VSSVEQQGCGVLVFLWESDSRVRKFRTPDSSTKNPGLRLRAQNHTPTPGLIVWHNDCVLKNDLSEIFNSSNKRCTLVYRVLDL